MSYCAILAAAEGAGNTNDHLTIGLLGQDRMAEDTVAPQVISRKDAKALGLKFYYTGKPCSRGHVDHRYVIQHKCVICARQNAAAQHKATPASIKNERSRQWRLNNLDRWKVLQKRWADANKESQAKYRLEWQKANAERCRGSWRRYKEKNAKALRKRSSELNRLNPAIKAAAKQRYRANKLSATGSHTSQDISEILRLQKGRCAYCRNKIAEDFTVDHIVALAKGGHNGRSNLQLACKPCNSSKRDKDPIAFAQGRGLLL